MGEEILDHASVQLFQVGNVDKDVCKQILDTFGYEDIPEDDDNEDQSTHVSQEFPFEQSQGQNTLKVCDLCPFTSRDDLTYKAHKLNHATCDTCGRNFKEKEDLAKHEQIHRLVPCNECQQEVRHDQMELHFQNHKNFKKFANDS